MELRVPAVKFVFREDGDFVTRSAIQLFDGKRVVIFALPGAFTPTCSIQQLPGYESFYDDFIASGVDDVYCISVNDAFVMNAWAKEHGITKVKLIPDGNSDFTREMGMLVSKGNYGFGNRSWRYAAVVDDGIVEWMTVEPGQKSDATEDPYGMTAPEEILKYLKRYAQKRAVNF
jgi:thioredoxin-dependent peroxiredoxin